LRIGLFHEIRPATLSAGLPNDIYYEFASLDTIQSMVLAIERAGHSVLLIDSQKSPMDRLYEEREALDLVFNFSVGFGSRFRELMPAAMCESVGVPYTGSDPMALAMSANKHVTKLIARDLGLCTPDWIVTDRDKVLDLALFRGKSVIVKPVFEGTSIGIAGPLPAADADGIRQAARRILDAYRQPALIEEFISGFEATVPLLGNPAEALPPLLLTVDTEANLGDRTFDGYLKEEGGVRVDWTTASPFGPVTADRMTDAALRMHYAIGCRDISRSDFRITAHGVPYFLEINAVPFLSPEGSAFVVAGLASGLSFCGVLNRIIDAAASRLKSAGVRHSQNQTSLGS
jgi:D-alanine-D-alanine ligase